MAYNYLRYAIVCPHFLQLFNHTIKGTLSFIQQSKGGVCASGK